MALFEDKDEPNGKWEESNEFKRLLQYEERTENEYKFEVKCTSVLTKMKSVLQIGLDVNANQNYSNEWK